MEFFCYWLLHQISLFYKIIKPFTQKQQSPVEWDINYILIKKLLMFWILLSFVDPVILWVIIQNWKSVLFYDFWCWCSSWTASWVNDNYFSQDKLLKKHNIYTFESMSCHFDTKHVIHVGVIQYPFRPRNRDRVSSYNKRKRKELLFYSKHILTLSVWLVSVTWL